MNIQSTKNVMSNNGVKILVYGMAGAGKTRLCATMPKPIIISAESGLMSLREYNLPYMEVTCLRDLEEALNFFKTDKNAARFESICLDSISEIAEIILHEEKMMAKDDRLAYGKMQDKVINVVKRFRDLQGFNVFFSSKMEKAEDVTGVRLFQPSMPGKALKEGVNSIDYYFDEVFALCNGTNENGEVIRWLITQNNGQYKAKDRSGCLNPVEQADLNIIIQKIKGGLNGNNSVE